MWAETLSNHTEQPQNPALDQLKQSIHTLQTSPELQQLPHSLSALFNKQLNRLDKTADPEQAKPQLNKINQTVRTLNQLKETLPESLWLEAFGKLISKLGEKWHQAIITTLAEKPLEEILQEVQDNGIPTTEIALKLFGKKMWIDTTLLNIEANKESENKNIDTANIESLTEIYHAIKNKTDNSPAFQLLKQVAKWGTESQQAYQELKALLLSEPEQLKALIDTIHQHDNTHNTKHLEAFKRTLISADPAFLEMLNVLGTPKTYKERTDTFSHAYVSSLTGYQPKMNGANITSVNKYGDTISVDMTTEPPLRTLTLEGSDYPLETNSEIWALHKPELKYSEQITELNTQLTTLNLLQSNFVQGHIEDLADHGANLNEIKHQFKNVYGINLDFINTIDELQTPAALEAKQGTIEQEIASLNDQYLKALDEAIKAHREEIFEQDEKTREVLQFIANIGFDVIPKQYTDQLITEVKAWTIIVEGLNMNPANIDLPNRKFWEPFLETNGTQWKKNLIGFYNKIISGSPEWPINTEAHLAGKTENRTELRHKLTQNGILSESGIFNIEKARGNLHLLKTK